MVKEEEGLERIHIDVMQSWHTESEKKLPVLCVRDDGGGMTAAMHRMMSFGVLEIIRTRSASEAW